jgi:hypothetical protein
MDERGRNPSVFLEYREQDKISPIGSCVSLVQCMSKIVRVYDPKRNPPEWHRLLTGSEVAVFAEDAHAEIPATNDMGEPTCEIFDTLQLAEAHCRELVAERLSTRYLMFDSRGRGAEPLTIVESPKLRTQELTGRFRRRFSSALIVASVLLIWIDWRSDFERMWPSIFAWKLITTALVFITWEAALLAQEYTLRRAQNPKTGSTAQRKGAG